VHRGAPPLLLLLLLAACQPPPPADPSSEGARSRATRPSTHGLPYRFLVDAVVDRESGRGEAAIEELREQRCADHRKQAVVFYHLILGERWHHLWVCSRPKPYRAATVAGAAKLQVWLDRLRAAVQARLRRCAPGAERALWRLEHESGVAGSGSCDGTSLFRLPGEAQVEAALPREPGAGSESWPDARTLFPLDARQEQAQFTPERIHVSGPVTRRVARKRGFKRPEEIGDEDTAFRLILSPVARPRPQANLGWGISDILFHQLDARLSERWQLGVQATLPVLWVGVFPQLRYVHPLSPNLAFGVHLSGGIFWPYLEPELLAGLFTTRFAAYGGGVYLSYQAGPVLLNAGLPVYGVRHGEREYRQDYDPVTKKLTKLSRVYFVDRWFAIPDLGLSWRVSRRVRLNLEVHVPLGDFEDVGKVWLLLYGVRVLGRGVYLDLTFLAPLCPGVSSFYSSLPLGVPMASVGLDW